MKEYDNSNILRYTIQIDDNIIVTLYECSARSDEALQGEAEVTL